MVSKNVGVDVGYGFVKVTDGDKEFVFPSVIGAGFRPAYRSDLANRSSLVDNLALTVDGRRYFVGSLAVRQSEVASRSLDPEREAGPGVRLLTLAALALYTPFDSQTFNVVTGLPTWGFARHRDAWTRLLKGTHKVKVLGPREDKEKSITIDQVRVVPQPLGTLYHRAMNSVGRVEQKDLAQSRVGLVDVGFLTTDLVMVDGMEFIERRSMSTTTALWTAWSMVAEAVRHEFGVVLANYELDRVMSEGRIRIRSAVHDLGDLCREALSWVAAKVVDEVVSLWDVRTLDTVLLTGGGAKALAEWLLPALGNAQLVDDAQLANARGYRKLAAYCFRAAGEENREAEGPVTATAAG